MSQNPAEHKGFASAVQPVTASTLIHTDTEGLLSGSANLQAADGQSLPIYYARPEAPGAHSVVLVVQEIFGLHEHIKDVVRRLAKLGYFAVAAELYFRQGDAASIDSIEGLLAGIVGKVPDAQVLADLDTTMAWAGAQGGDIDRLGVTGFCWGGRITWLYAAHQPRVKAAVAWYGRLTGETSALTPRHPVEVLGELKAPVLGLYGGQDGSIPLDTVALVQQGLEAIHSLSRIEVYPDAPHAFYADYRPSYRTADAADGWQQLQAWFRRFGL